MSASELLEALAIEEEASELDKENLPELNDVVNVCAGLVTVDEDSNVIRLVHYTTQDFFERILPDWNLDAQTAITKACITYLSFDSFQGASERSIESQSGDCRGICENYPLLRYTCLYWASHLRESWSESTEKLALSFIQEKINITLCSAILDDGQLLPVFPTTLSNFQALHFAAYLGLDQLVSALIRESYDPQVRDSKGRTPLFYAASKGHEAVIELLTRTHEMDPNDVDNEDRTALHYAIMEGLEDAIQILLDQKGINVNQKDKDGDTPLLKAIKCRYAGVAEQLIERNDVDINSLDDYCNSALSIASANGNETLVRLLLKRSNVSTSVPGHLDMAPLVRAASNNHERIVTLLLEREDIANSAEMSSSALNEAIRERNRSRVSRRCDRYYGSLSTSIGWIYTKNAQFSYRDSRGRVARTGIAYCGDWQVVQLLLERSNIHVNYGDWTDWNRTALMLAANYGDVKICELLLQKSDIDVNCRDLQGRTALMLAACWGHRGVVELFLKRDDVDLNCRDRWNYTALMLANVRDYREVAKILEEAGALGDLSERRLPCDGTRHVRAHHVRYPWTKNEESARVKGEEDVGCESAEDTGIEIEEA